MVIHVLLSLYHNLLHLRIPGLNPFPAQPPSSICAQAYALNTRTVGVPHVCLFVCLFVFKSCVFVLSANTPSVCVWISQCSRCDDEASVAGVAVSCCSTTLVSCSGLNETMNHCMNVDFPTSAAAQGCVIDATMMAIEAF